MDSATLHTEAVTEALLDPTVARTVDGARRIVDLRNGSVAPIKRPSVACRWCPVRPACAEGRAHLRDAGLDDDLDDGDSFGGDLAGADDDELIAVDT